MKRSESELLQVWVPTAMIDDLQKWADDEEESDRSKLVRRLLRKCLQRRANAVRMRGSRQRRRESAAA